MAATRPAKIRSSLAEWSNPNRLARDGVRKTTLKIGDVVVIAGSPGRNPDDHRVHLKAIKTG